MRRLLILTIALACFGIAAWNLHRHRAAGRAGENRRVTAPMFFRCEKCGHAFQLSVKDFVAEWKDVVPGRPSELEKAHCDACKNRFCAFQISAADFQRGDADPRTSPRRGETPAPKPPSQLPKPE